MESDNSLDLVDRPVSSEAHSLLKLGTGTVDIEFSASNQTMGDPTDNFEWSPIVVIKVAGLFLFAGLAEIGGGWFVWQAVRESKPWWWAVIGSLVLVAYGFVPTLQPLSDFGRLYAVYGGIFIVLSYGWGAIFDGMHIDWGDMIGSTLALLGVCVALFWPRSS